jgi:hypothetical protein
MSILEMKLTVIKEISNIEDEIVLKEIFLYLENIAIQKDNNTINLSQHYDLVKGRYGNVLKKLAE